jgi:hypothetical protein
MDHDSGEARQMWMCQMSDDPQQYRRGPFAGILEQCSNARYGNDDGGRDFLTCPF